MEGNNIPSKLREPEGGEAMHGGFPCLTQNVDFLLKFGAKKAKVPGLLDRAEATFLAGGMALLLKLGLAFVMRGSMLRRSRSRKAEEFFRENFEIRDPESPKGIRYYQGKILVRTDKPEDDMNVYLKFCPDPGVLFTRGWLGRIKKAIFGTALAPFAVVQTDVLTEKEADTIARDPDKVDLVISFKDVKTIEDLVKNPDFDMGALLLKNVVRMKGNLGHLFKFGAIAKNIELALGLSS